MVIYKTVSVVYKSKMEHARKVGRKFRLFRSFILDYGDVPVARFNEVTGKIEPVENNRGRAYAARNRLCYRNK